MIDMETDYSPIFDILEEILGDHRNHNDYNGQVAFNCPVCSYEIKGLDKLDGKYNLEVNYIQNVYQCWSCGGTHDTHGSLYKLIKTYGTKKQLENYKLLRPESGGEVKEKKYKRVALPKEFISIRNASVGMKLTHHYKTAMNYLKSRNIGEDLINKYNIGFCYDGPYANRIIIPSYNEYKNINYFIARSYLSYSKLKYKNPEAEKESIIWNEHLINWEKPVYIVEGVFDSIFLPNSIPMLGKFMSENLFNLLYEKVKDKIIIVLDPDAWAASEKLFHQLNVGKLFLKVWVVKLDGDKDIADLKGDISNYSIKQLD